MLQRRLYVEWFVVAILAGALAWLATANQRLSMLDHRVYDLSLRFVGPPVDPRILIVEIDEPSLKALGRWPWPRSEHARLLNAVSAQRPAAIGYSVLFLDASRDDAMLADAMLAAAPVYLPALVESDASGTTLTAQRPPAPLADAAAGFGSVELEPDEDGVVRRMPAAVVADGQGLPPLYALLDPERDETQPDAGANALINYAARDSFRRISFASLAAGEVPPALVKDKLLLIGATAPGLANQQPVPRHAGGLLSGVEIEANLLNTRLRDAAIQTLTRQQRGTLALVPVVLLMAGFLRLSPSAASWLAAGLAGVAVAASLALLLLAHVWWPPAGTVAGLIAAHVLWGWRRLTAIGRFLLARVNALEREPGLALAPAAPQHGGDLMSRDAGRLAGLIDQLRDLRAFVSEAIEWLPAAICVADREGRIVLVNRAAAGLFGEDTVGCLIADVTCTLRAVPEGENGLLRDAAGRFFLPATADLSGDFRIYSYADVTELQRIAEERDDILQFLSHDIRTPNAAIVTLLETETLAGHRQGAEVPRTATLDEIRRHARHALRLADDFVQLARARRRSMEPEPLDLCDVAREAADMVWPRAHAKQVSVNERCAAGEVWVMGDRSMILRAALNLLENAVKFAPDGATVGFGVAAGDRCAVLTVEGPGPAMPAGRAANPFALYAEGRAADGTGSLGLGLAFVQTMAQRHGGDVTYVHRAGWGGKFRVELPLAELDDEVA